MADVPEISCYFGVDIICVFEPDTNCSGITATDTVVCNNPYCYIHPILDNPTVDPIYAEGWDAFNVFIDSTLYIDRFICQRGIIYASFIVNVDGSCSDFKIRRGISEQLDQEVLRVLKLMPKWNPALECDKPVRCRVTVPVKIGYD